MRSILSAFRKSSDNDSFGMTNSERVVIYPAMVALVLSAAYVGNNWDNISGFFTGNQGVEQDGQSFSAPNRTP